MRSVLSKREKNPSLHKLLTFLFKRIKLCSSIKLSIILTTHTTEASLKKYISDHYLIFKYILLIITNKHKRLRLQPKVPTQKSSLKAYVP